MTPGELLQISSFYWKSSTLHCGVKLDLFSHIDGGSRTAAQLAGQTGGDQEAMVLLLNALVAMGLLDQEGDRYVNTPPSAQFLVKGRPEYQGYIIMHHFHLVDAWAQLDQAVLHGGPVSKRSHGEELERQSFLLGMYNLAMKTAPEIAKQVDLDGRRHLLDLGGGPGTHAIFFCQENRELRATIFDRPSTREIADRIVGEHRLSDRIDFLAGNFLDDPLGGPYDVAWLSHILHSNGAQACQRLIDRVVASLEPGGLILVHDFFLDDSRCRPLFPALFSLNMLVNNGVGRSYSEKEVVAMLQTAGIGQIERLPYQGPNDSYVICGTR